MDHRTWWIVAAALCVTGLCGGQAESAIYMDEDFEGVAPFVDRDFPVTNTSDLPQTPLVQGINLRAYDSGITTPKVEIGTHTGTVVTERSWSGDKSLRLQSGQALAVTPGQFPVRDTNWFRVWQFCLNTDAASLALPQGTRVGHFKIDYSTEGTGDLNPDVVVQLDFVVNATGTLNVTCANNGATLTTLSGTSEDWAVVTLLSMNRVTEGARLDTTVGWAAYDPLTYAWKGPPPPPPTPPVSTGIHLYVDGASAGRLVTLTRAGHLGTAWGNEGGSAPSQTAEIGWRFEAENGGTIYLDNLYWDAAMHQEINQGFENEQAARMNPFAGSGSLDPGVPSPITRVYVIGHTHLDIGFNEPPEAIAARHKVILDGQIGYARTRPGYKWNIEETWTLEEWAERSTPAEIDELVDMVLAGQFGVAGGHSTLHSGKAGVEQLHRLLWNAERYRRDFGFTIETVIHDDVPGVSWAYPQALARCGIKYLICGTNLFIGGGFTQPYDSYPFYWQGPDGSRVLTWSARNNYTEGFSVYGIPWLSADPIDESALADALSALTNAGYPYDAVLVQQAFDNASITLHADAMVSWNSTHDNPKFILATPEEFFEYLTGKYDAIIPVRSGNWTTIWDTSSMAEPKSEIIAREVQDQLPSAEKMWSIASLYEMGDYPYAEFDNAWDMILNVDEHSGGGLVWSGMFTQQQVDDNGLEHYGYALSASQSLRSTLESAEDTLLAAMSTPGSETIVVFNPLSWTRTDLVRIQVSPALFVREFTLTDAANAQNVPYQKVAEDSSLLFVAEAVPPVGCKRFNVVDTPPPATGTSLATGADFVENDLFRVQVASDGTISSLSDKAAGRQLVDSADPFDFNRLIVGTNLECFLGAHRSVPPPASTTMAAALDGPVAASLRISNSAHPLAGVEIVLYERLDRIDIVNTVDREPMEYAPLDVNSVYYALTFPFDLAGYTARLETAAGWLNPAVDSLPGSYRGAHIIQHGIDLSENDYGVTFSTPDVYGHSFGGFQTTWGPAAPAEPTLVSTFIRYADEVELVGGATGQANPEPGSPTQWDLRYSLRPHAGGFDATRETRFAWESCVPLIARELPAASGTFEADRLSFFSVDAPGVLITDIKKADYGEGLILKLQEITGADRPAVVLHSEAFRFAGVVETTPLEEDIAPLFSAPPGDEPAEVAFDLGAYEIKTLRLNLLVSNPMSIPNWVLY